MKGGWTITHPAVLWGARQFASLDVNPDYKGVLLGGDRPDGAVLQDMWVLHNSGAANPISRCTTLCVSNRVFVYVLARVGLRGGGVGSVTPVCMTLYVQSQP